ncbi:MAG: helix-turn-helix domain-containing protein [Coriobacteriales bacterium]|jgi:transcriptional regulator with XRE-family HTH domain
MSNAEVIGHNIRAVRAEKGLTQREVSEMAEISTSQLSAYENGKQMIGLISIAKIARALDTSIDRLYFGKPSEAFLNESEDFGETVVNCFRKLYELGITTDVRVCFEPGEADVAKCAF